MDEQQFAQFLQVQQQNFQTMLQQFTNMNPSTNHQNVSKFDNFDKNKETFQQYKERFDNFLAMKGLESDKSASKTILLNSIGPEFFELLKLSVAPRKINTLDFDEVVEVLNDQLTEKKNILVERHKFLSQKQGPDQSIQDFVTQLRKFISTCEFTCECKKSVANLFLHSQFIRGLSNQDIRHQLLLDDSKTFQDAVSKAQTLEASNLANQQFNTPVENTPTNIYRVSRPQSRSSSSHSSRSRETANSEHREYQNSASPPRYKPRLNLKHLGIEGLCIKCGRNNHNSKHCRIDSNNLKCGYCGKLGHVEKVCLKRLMSENKGVKSIDTEDSLLHDQFTIYEIDNTDQDTEKFIVQVKINNKIQQFEVDSGAGQTLLNKSNFDKLNLNTKLQDTKIRFRSYTAGIFAPIGVTKVEVQYKELKSLETLYIVADNFTPLLGRSWIRHLNIQLQDIDTKKVNTSSILSVIPVNIEKVILNKYSELFQKQVGCCKNIQLSLKLRKNAKPIAFKAREVPHALKQKVEQELDSLENQGIISKVHESDWASPLVVIPKADGSVRLCVDYKVGVNPQLQDAHYPIPRIDDLLTALNDSAYYCSLDLVKAYLHIPVDNESAKIQTIITHKGSYSFNRLSFGIKTAPNDFHLVMDKVLAGLKGVTTYFDNIIVHATTREECYSNLTACLDRLLEFDLHLNIEKCEFFKTKVQYLGYVIEQGKICKDPTKVTAITNAPRPTSHDDVKRFLGLVTYYSKFIPNTSTLTYPLRLLLQKHRKFYWSSACEAAFMQLKNEIASEKVLTPFNPDLPLVIDCDASPTGISGILSHTINGIDKPIAFASRSLTKTEMNYSQLDREALAIVFALKKFYYYIYGRKFTLFTDNRPLTHILNENSKLPAMTSARLLRYATWLTNFDYEIKHKKAEENIHADFLSRASITENISQVEEYIEEEVSLLSNEVIYQISSEALNYETLAHETSLDEQLSKLKSELLHGGSYDSEYYLQNDVIFKGQRVVIPASMQQIVLKELHHTHVGIVKMKQLARRYVYWGGLDRDIENVVKACQDCGRVRKNPQRVPVHHWDEPSENFERVHMDYAGPFQDHHFFIVVDAKSRWLEVRYSKNAPTTDSTIQYLQDMFSVHGLPRTLVSDNATIFKSETFTKFCTDQGIHQKFIAPGHPSTNGLAERNVQTVKQKLQAMTSSKLPLQRKIQEILMRYRATPLSCGKSPSELYLNRKLRIKLDLLKPPSRTPSPSNTTPRVRHLYVGDRIQARWYLPTGKQTWRSGTIVQKLGKLHYLVKLDDGGYCLKRHIDQLLKTSDDSKPRKRVTFAPSMDNINQPNNDENNGHFTEEPQPEPPEVQPELRRSTRERRPPASLKDYIVSF
jgi:transposase InsO family protein